MYLSSRTQTARAGMACGISPCGTTPTHSPGNSGSLVRTRAPRREISRVKAEPSDMVGPPFNTRLTGIVFGLRSHRRELIVVVMAIAETSVLGQNFGLTGTLMRVSSGTD